MAPIKISKVISVSSEDKVHCADNLLHSDSFKKWSTERAGVSKATVLLQLESEERITGVDIGNNGSAFVQVMVGKSSCGADSMDYLITTTAFMSASEARGNSNPFQIRMFSKSDLCKSTLNGKWDRVKIECTQPFNRNIKFGLSLITVHGEPKPVSQETVTKGVGSNQRKGVIFAPSKGVTQSNDTVSTPPRAPSTPNRPISTPQRNSKEEVSSEKNVASRLLAGLEKDKKRTSESALKDLKEHGATKTFKSTISSSSKRVLDISIESPASSSSSKSPTRKTKSIPFNKILSGVVIVISGYQNPLRKDIRELAISMGAQYRPDWVSSATHLICSIPDTPKYKQVLGKGIILKKEWLFTCRNKRLRVPEDPFRMDTNEEQDESENEGGENESDEIEQVSKDDKRKRRHGNISYVEEEDSDSESRPRKKKKAKGDDSYEPESEPDEDQEDADLFDQMDSDEGESEEEIEGEPEKKVQQKKVSTLPDVSDSEDDDEDGGNVGIYDAETDAETEDDVVKRLNLPPLPNFFAGHNFFLHRDQLDSAAIASLSRFLIAFGGTLHEYMSPTVQFIVTAAPRWQRDFRDALEVNPEVKFLKDAWVKESAAQQTAIPKQRYYLQEK